MKKIKINEAKITNIVSESVRKILLENINSSQDLVSLLGGNPTKAAFNMISILNFLNKNGVISGFNIEKLRNLILGNDTKKVDQYGLPISDSDNFNDYEDFDKEFGGMSRL